MITDPNAKGYRPPCCDGGTGGCCTGGCVADSELLELADARGAALPDTQVLDIAKRCGVKGSGAALVEFAALVREAEPLVAGDVFGKTEILHRSGGQVDPCMALPHVRTAEPTPNTAGSSTGIDLATVPCPTCNDRCGERKADAWHACDDCNGQGRVIVRRSDIPQPLASTAATQPGQAGEHEAFKAAMVAANYVGSMFDYFLAEGAITYHDPVANQMYDAWEAGRAALAIPASTAASEQQASDAPYPLTEYAPGQWWLQSLAALAGHGACDLDTRRAAHIAGNFAAAVFAEQAGRATIPSDADERAPMSKAQIDAIVYECRQRGDDSTYAIVNAALAAQPQRRRHK